MIVRDALLLAILVVLIAGVGVILAWSNVARRAAERASSDTAALLLLIEQTSRRNLHQLRLIADALGAQQVRNHEEEG
jgi:hypothetical protein